MARVQDKNDIRQYSRKPKSRGTLAGSLDVLRRFSNLRDEDVEKFRSQHPDFFVSPALTEEGWVEGVVHRLGGGGPRLISTRALALAETVARAQPDRALRIRELLRFIWRGDENADDYLKIVLSGSRMRFNWRR